MTHHPSCLCVECLPLGPPETRPERCRCCEAGGGLVCSPEEQVLCGWRDVGPGELVLVEREESKL